MKFVILCSIFFILASFQLTYAVTLEVFTDNKVYTDGRPLLVFGKSLPYETLIVRMFAPDGTIPIFEQIESESDGTFHHILLKWPTSSTTFPYGTYTVEVISNTQNGLSKKIDVKFTSTTELVEVPVERQVNTLVFAPEAVAINQPFRVFVQTTSDGQLVGGDPVRLLETSHVHLPSGEVQNLSTSFQTLHQGLYYVDFTANQEGTYIFHIVLFSQGTISHGSAATQVLKQDIPGISNQILKLNAILDETSDELSKLKSEIEGFGSTLEKASSNIDTSVLSISSSVDNIEEASLQLNSLFFPIVASIGIIVALQIAILARRR